MLTENRFSLEGRLFHSTEVIFHLPKLNEKYISVRVLSTITNRTEIY